MYKNFDTSTLVKKKKKILSNKIKYELMFYVKNHLNRNSHLNMCFKIIRQINLKLDKDKYVVDILVKENFNQI